MRDTLISRITNEYIDPIKLYNTNITNIKGAFKKKNEAIVYKFDLFDSSICLCNVHLFQGHGSDRAQQRKQEIEKVFTDAFKSDKFGMVRGEQSVQAADQIIFFGSLNFRPNMDEATITSLCKNMDIKPPAGYTPTELSTIYRILEDDEFESLQSSQDSALKGFSEGHIKFGPTYKFDKKTGTFVNKQGYSCAW